MAFIQIFDGFRFVDGERSPKWEGEAPTIAAAMEIADLKHQYIWFDQITQAVKLADEHDLNVQIVICFSYEEDSKQGLDSASDVQVLTSINLHKVYGDNIFGRMNEDGNVLVLHVEDGLPVTQMDCNLYSVGSDGSKCVRYEHPEGIVLTLDDARSIGLPIEDINLP